MRHIDAMSKLREEVAFEWYAQKQPLVVYKEKAFRKFEDLIDEIEYKVTKTIFNLVKPEEQEVEIDSEEAKLLEELIEKSQQEINDFRKQKENPLFNSWENVEVKKIRV
jgi:preprotein translocase subunit SecA